jgi:hypothetical protein
MKGILLDKNNDLAIKVKHDANGKIGAGLVVGDRKMQDAYIVLNMNQGELKEDPIVGANLLRNMRMKEDKNKIRNDIAISLSRISIDIEDIKNEVEIMINKNIVQL